MSIATLLKSEGLTGADADQLLAHARRLEDEAESASSRTRADALNTKAEQLRTHAAKLENDADTVDDPSSSPAPKAAKAPPKRKRAAASAPRVKPLAKRARKGGSALSGSRAAAPTVAAASSATSLFWEVIGYTFLFVLLYRLLTVSSAAAGLLGHVQNGVMKVVYPPAAFPADPGSPTYNPDVHDKVVRPGRPGKPPIIERYNPNVSPGGGSTQVPGR